MYKGTKRFHLVYTRTMKRLDRFRALIYDYNFVNMKSFYKNRKMEPFYTKHSKIQTPREYPF